jgi:hypothetical protein
MKEEGHSKITSMNEDNTTGGSGAKKKRAVSAGKSMLTNVLNAKDKKDPRMYT